MNRMSQRREYALRKKGYLTKEGARQGLRLRAANATLNAIKAGTVITNATKWMGLHDHDLTFDPAWDEVLSGKKAINKAQREQLRLVEEEQVRLGQWTLLSDKEVTEKLLARELQQPIGQRNEPIAANVRGVDELAIDDKLEINGYRAEIEEHSDLRRGQAGQVQEKAEMLYRDQYREKVRAYRESVDGLMKASANRPREDRIAFLTRNGVRREMAEQWIGEEGQREQPITECFCERCARESLQKEIGTHRIKTAEYQAFASEQRERHMTEAERYKQRVRAQQHEAQDRHDMVAARAHYEEARAWDSQCNEQELRHEEEKQRSHGR